MCYVELAQSVAVGHCRHCAFNLLTLQGQRLRNVPPPRAMRHSRELGRTAHVHVCTILYRFSQREIMVNAFDLLVTILNFVI